jgi:hypothetical protein
MKSRRGHGPECTGGDKTGNDRRYEEQVPVADRLYDEHLRQLERERLI